MRAAGVMGNPRDGSGGWGEVVSGRAETQPCWRVWSMEPLRVSYVCVLLSVTVRTAGQLGYFLSGGFFICLGYFFHLFGSCSQHVKYVKTHSVLFGF